MLINETKTTKVIQFGSIFLNASISDYQLMMMMIMVMTTMMIMTTTMMKIMMMTTTYISKYFLITVTHLLASWFIIDAGCKLPDQTRNRNNTTITKKKRQNNNQQEQYYKNIHSVIKKTQSKVALLLILHKYLISNSLTISHTDFTVFVLTTRCQKAFQICVLLLECLVVLKIVCYVLGR